MLAIPAKVLQSSQEGWCKPLSSTWKRRHGLFL